MLDLIGVEYLTSCLSAAVTARVRDDTFRVYVTDRLHTLCSWTGNPPPVRYLDILRPEQAPDDPCDGDEIVRERLDRFGIKVVN